MGASICAWFASLAAGCCIFCVACLVLDRIDLLRRQSWRGHNLSLEQVLQDSTLSFVLFAAIGCVLAVAISPWLIVPVLICAYILSRRLPQTMRRRKEEALRRSCEQDLDILADIVVLGVRSGLSFDAALDLYCEKFDTPLSRELSEGVAQWHGGLASRQEALTGVGEKIGSTDFERFSQTVVHALAHGSPLADMLARFADDMREQRQTGIERRVEKAPVKILIPLGVCILPAMLILVMGPVLLQFLDSGI